MNVDLYDDLAKIATTIAERRLHFSGHCWRMHQAGNYQQNHTVGSYSGKGSCGHPA